MKKTGLPDTLTWDIQTEPLLLGNSVTPRKKAIVRDDTGEVLGIVGRNYSPLSNATFMQIAGAIASTGQFDIDVGAGAVARQRRTRRMHQLQRTHFGGHLQHLLDADGDDAVEHDVQRLSGMQAVASTSMRTCGPGSMPLTSTTVDTGGSPG